MLLEGSCHCEAIRFRVDSPEPYPFMRCYCSICRKTAGGGGYAINLGALYETLEEEGGENLSVYNAKLYDRGEVDEVEVSPAERNFCRLCGSALWLYDPRWPELVHPFASAIDTPLPKPPERVHIMLDYAVPWCDVPSGPNERHYPIYPDESLAEWHRCHGLLDETGSR
ncbi:GFA family protein [soil metagenome]